jgi:hypothetical protein
MILLKMWTLQPAKNPRGSVQQTGAVHSSASVARRSQNRQIEKAIHQIKKVAEARHG